MRIKNRAADWLPCFSLSKSLAEFAPAGAKKSSHHVRRRTRRRKYFMPCKLREPPRAQAVRSAISQGELMQNKVLSWNLCANCAQMIRAADCKPSQTRTQHSGLRLRACQKYFFDTLKQGSRLAALFFNFVITLRRPRSRRQQQGQAAHGWRAKCACAPRRCR